MRARNPGSSSTGSTSPNNVRRGSAFDTTVAARSSSPEVSVTPATRPFRTSIRPTSASVRIFAPAARAADASAELNAPSPPRTNLGTPSPVAICMRSTAVLPADRGPSAVPKMPRAAKDCSKRFGLEPLRDEVCHRHRPPAQQPIRVFLSKAAEAVRQLQQRPEVTARRIFDLGRRTRHDGGHERRNASDNRPELGVTVRILPGKLLNARCRRRGVAAQEQTPSIREWREKIWIRIDHLEPVLGETEARSIPLHPAAPREPTWKVDIQDAALQ